MDRLIGSRQVSAVFVLTLSSLISIARRNAMFHRCLMHLSIEHPIPRSNGVIGETKFLLHGLWSDDDLTGTFKRMSGHRLRTRLDAKATKVCGMLVCVVSVAW